MLNLAKTTNNKIIRPGRLKKRPEFLCVAKTNIKWVSDSVIVQARAITDENALFKYGVTATKKIGNAVVRNRAKRRLRALIDDIASDNTLENFDIVMIARHNTPTIENAKLTKDLKWCLKRLGVIT